MSTWEIGGLVVQHVGSILSVALILAILSGKKEARATLGWVLLVLFLPYVGALAYLVFGRSPMRFPALEDPAASLLCPLPPEGVPEPMERTTKLTGREPTPCHSLELLPDAEVKYRRLTADVEAARRRIVVCYYVFRADETGRRFLELLTRKASEGVEVLLLYDGWGSFGLGFGGRLRQYRARGLRTQAFHPVVDPFQMSRINFRNHRKIVVIDGRLAYTGSINIGDEYLGLHPRLGPWKDIHARLEGAAAWALETVFREDWKIATGESLDPSPPPAESGGTWVHVIASGSEQRQDSLFPLIFAQFASAKKRIDILTPYLIPDHGLVAALRVVARQGVLVRVFVPGRSNHPLVAAAGRSYYDELLDWGVELYKTRHGMLHAKGILVDGQWAMVGSTNLDNRSLHLNREINVATSDPAFCRSLGRLFESWISDATQITSERLAGRSLPRRLLEGACRTLSPVL